MIISLIIFGIVVFLAIALAPSFLVSIGVHLLIKLFHSPSVLWIVINYLIGAGGVVVHLIINNDGAESATQFWITATIAALYGLVSVIWYFIRRSLRAKELERKLSKVTYIDPEELYYLKDGESGDAAIDRLNDEIFDWVDVMMKHLEFSAREIEFAVGRFGFGIKLIMRSRNAKLNPRAVAAMLDKLQETCTKSDYIMEQIQIRFELIFELMEELGYDSWMDAREYKRLFYGIRKLQDQMTGWLDLFKDVSENATYAFDQKNITWASDLMDCRTACKMITESFETSISRIDWIIEKIDEVSSVENNDVSYKLETPVVQNEEPVLNNDEHEDVHLSAEDAKTELPVEQNKSLGRKIFVIIAKVLICITCTVTAIMGFGFLISSMPSGALICWAITAGLIFVAGKIK